MSEQRFKVGQTVSLKKNRTVNLTVTKCGEDEAKKQKQIHARRVDNGTEQSYWADELVIG